jgi:hypothetical protein
MKFQIPAEIVLECAKFAVSVEQSARQFGSQDQRGRAQMILDTFEGKLAEIALALLARGHGYEASLDFALYALGQGDGGSDLSVLARDGDTRLLTQKVDVKGIGPRSGWLLVEKHKFGADFYVLVRHQLSREQLHRMVVVERRLEAIPIEVVGYASRLMFTAPDGLPYVELARGERLRALPEIWQTDRPDSMGWLQVFRQGWPSWPEMGPRLDAPKNVGLYARWLSTDFDHLLNHLWSTAIPAEPAEAA